MKNVVTAAEKVTAGSSEKFFLWELNLAEKADDKEPTCAAKKREKIEFSTEEDWLSFFSSFFFFLNSIPGCQG